MDMNISKYQALVTAVEYGSFTKAAEILNYSQSAISRMIRDLEREWKIPVLDRSKAGVRLTSDGMQLLPYARTLCEEYRKLQMQLDALHGMQAGTLRIGTFSGVATHWLPNILKAFQKDYPNMDYELLLGDHREIENWILEGRVDCGFLRLPTGAELDTVFLEQDPLLAVLPQNHALAGKETVTAAELCHDPFLMLRKGENDEVAEVFAGGALTPNVRFTTWDDYAIMSMVEGGFGISVLPELILKRIPYRIVCKPLAMPVYRKIGFAVKHKKTMSLAVQKFTQYLKYR